jgi:hypothetical protein
MSSAPTSSAAMSAAPRSGSSSAPDGPRARLTGDQPDDHLQEVLKVGGHSAVRGHRALDVLPA